MLALRELFRGEASFSGRFFSFQDVRIEPGPAQDGGPPLWVGGRSNAAIRRAGTLGDGWMPIWVSAERFAAGLAEARSSGREITGAVVLPALVGDDAAGRLADHLAHRYAMEVSPNLVERYCCAGPVEVCAARVREYADAGAEHVIFNLGCEPSEFFEQMELLRGVG
jgi:alkanesulfonate monooxygenase SsuD/methylene tetrahydromethanopterin reductase-like flavin-dependent oxidoreductase (luciferase family)